MSEAVSFAGLGYDERLFLLAYKKILGKRYKFRDANRGAENISEDHVEAQKIGYVLCYLQLLANYCFSWNKRGPFSSKFQELLLHLDRVPDLVAEFYEEQAQICNDLLPECLGNMLDRVSRPLNHYVDQGSITDNIELLGSLLYIDATVLPGQGFEAVNTELQARKPVFDDREQNFKAWNCLRESGLILSD